MVHEVVDSDVSDQDGVHGGLFQGIKFWLSVRVPQRSRFINEVQANGGEVLPLENQADIKIVDHAKKEALPGTYSYTYIEKSIRNGTLENLEDHVVGPPVGTVRSIGSISHPAKTQRTKFTEGDDRILWNWVHEYQQKGGRTDGNDIYKQLEATNSRHPWQSWRDRYVKHLRHHPQPSFAVSNARPPATSIQPLIVIESKKPQNGEIEKLKRTKDFSKEDAIALYDRGEDILEIAPDNIKNAWEDWALKFDSDQNHSAGDWQEFWENQIRPKYLARNPKKTAMRPSSGKRKPLSTRSRSPSFPVKSRSGSVGSSSETQQIESADSGNQLITEVSGSDPPESEESFYPSLEAQEQNHVPLKRETEVSEESPSSSPTPVKRRRAFEKILSSPLAEHLKREPGVFVEIPSSSPSMPMKRKREPFEEIPNSLPLESEYPTKKRRQIKTSPPIEIASTPDQSPVRNNTVSSPETSEDENLQTVDEISDEIHQNEVDESIDQESTQEAHGSYGRQASPILSEPDNAAGPTQAIFQDLTQSIDLDVPLPEEGWDNKEEEALENTGPELQPQIVDTQGLLNGPTQGLDLSLPEPNGGWNSDHMPSSPETSDSPLADNLHQAEINARLDAWIDGQVAAGYSADEAISALECTSLDHRLADEVLEYMKAHRGRIPPERRGVWTEGDGEDLDSTDARRILRAEEKHGKKLVALRWAFLAAYRK